MKSTLTTKVILAFAFLYFSTTSHAQQFAFSPEAGINLTPIGEVTNGQDFRIGALGGLNVEYMFKGNFSLRSGVFFVQKFKAYEAMETRSLFDEFGELFMLVGISPDDFLGIEGVSFDILDRVEGVVNIGYLELPLIANYRIGNLEVFAGGYAATALTAKRRELVRSNIPILQAIDLASLDPTGFINLLLPDPESSETRTSTDKSGISTWDFGAMGGLAYNMDNLLFKVQYAYGFLDYETDPESASSLNTHQGVRISLAYRIMGAKKDPAP